MAADQFAGLAVLYIEDDEGIRQSILTLLNVWGIPVEGADDASSGLSRLAQQSFSVVIADFSLPDMSGPDLIGSIKDRFPDIVLIVASGHHKDDVLAKCAPGLLPDYFVDKVSMARELKAILLEVANRG